MMIACRLKGFTIFLTVLLCCNNTFSQSHTLSLRDALKQVTKVYGAQFVFDPELIDGKISSFQVVNKKLPVEDVLKEILYPHDLVFLYIKSNYYSIVSKARLTKLANTGFTVVETSNPAVSPGTVAAGKAVDNDLVKGRVTNSSDGTPLEG